MKTNPGIIKVDKVDTGLGRGGRIFRLGLTHSNDPSKTLKILERIVKERNMKLNRIWLAERSLPCHEDNQ